MRMAAEETGRMLHRRRYERTASLVPTTSPDCFPPRRSRDQPRELTAIWAEASIEVPDLHKLISRSRRYSKQQSVFPFVYKRMLLTLSIGSTSRIRWWTSRTSTSDDQRRRIRLACIRLARRSSSRDLLGWKQPSH